MFAESGVGALGMSTRVGELCAFKEFCMGGVRGRGLGALAMSTYVGELNVL